MLPYVLSIIPIVFFINSKNNNKRFKIAVIIWLVVLVLVAGLRGNMTTDFLAYKAMFDEYKAYSWQSLFGSLSLDYHFNGIELGYFVENFIVSRFTNGYVWCQIVTALVMCGSVFVFLRESKDFALSVLLFLSIGIFLEGFNVVREVMAACIWSISIKHIVNRDFFKYIFWVIIASLFHSTSVIMIPFYFILHKKPNIKVIITYLVCVLIFLAFIDDIAVFANNIFHFSSSNDGILYMLYSRHHSFGAVFLSVLLSFFCIFLYYYRPSYFSGEEQKKEYVLVNGVIVWLLLRLMMMKYGYMERLAEFFSMFILLLLPMQLKKLNGLSRKIVKFCLGLILIIYYFYAAHVSYGDYITIFS